MAMIDNGGRRWAGERRRHVVFGFSPDRRAGHDRRSGIDRRSGSDRRSPLGFRAIIGLDRRQWIRFLD